MKRLAHFVGLAAIVLAFFSLPSFSERKVYAQECGGLVPHVPTQVWTASGPGYGQVTVHWQTAAYADRYAISYGEKSGEYIYGALNIGGAESRSYTVSHLQASKRYYFRLIPAHGCSVGPQSAEFSAVAGTKGGTGTMMGTGSMSKGASMQQGPVGSLMLRAIPGWNTGEVTLIWQKAGGATDYHLMYGTENGKFEYGALNIGNTTTFTVRKLTPGATYYFALVPIADGKLLPTTPAVQSPAKSYQSSVSAPTAGMQQGAMPSYQSEGPSSPSDENEDMYVLSPIESKKEMLPRIGSAEEPFGFPSKMQQQSVQPQNAGIYTAAPETQGMRPTEGAFGFETGTQQIGKTENTSGDMFFAAPIEESNQDSSENLFGY